MILDALVAIAVVVGLFAAAILAFILTARIVEWLDRRGWL